MGGDLRQLGGDFLAKALEPEGPPPARKTLGGKKKLSWVGQGGMEVDSLQSATKRLGIAL